MFARALLLGSLSIAAVTGQGILHLGHGARDAGAAGVFAATDGDALAVMQTNPAALDALEANQWTFALRGGLAKGRFTAAGLGYDMDEIGAFPEFGFSWRGGDSPLTLGLSMAPVALASAAWTYPDAPGGIGGISYGSAVAHDSGFAALRANAGLSWRISEQLAIGASLGAVYGRVDFDAPFIFQTNPALAGAKVNLDLETDGWEPMSEFGLLWRPSPAWRVALRYRPQVDLDLEGDAAADFSAQLPVLGLGGAPSFAAYQARTGNALPAIAGAAVSWTPDARWKLGLRVDWIGWGSAFDTLDVSLSGGSNAGINAAIGANPNDRVPVGWEDRWLVALGAEYQVDDCWTLRGGWRWSESPVSSAWVTPLNGALLEHTLAVGLGYRRDCWRVDLSYEYRFGPSAKVGTSGYRAGEYSNTKLDLGAHVFGLGVTVDY